jgi:hypothetical protein
VLPPAEKPSNTPNNDASHLSTPLLPNQYFDPVQQKSRKEIVKSIETQNHHFFLPFDLLFGAGAGLEAFDMTLEALEEGAAEVALLPAPDLMLSSALFCKSS